MVLSALLALFLLGDAVVRGGWAQTLLLAPWVLLGLWLVYVISFVSHLRVDDDGVLVQNGLRRTTFGWSRVRDIDFRWQVVFSLDDGADLTSYGGPAHSRPMRSRMRDEAESKVPVGVRELADLRDRWQAADGASVDPIRRTWDGRALIALAVIVLWAASTIFIVAVS